MTPREAWIERMSCPLDVTIREHGRVILQTYRRNGKIITMVRDPKTGRFRRHNQERRSK